MKDNSYCVYTVGQHSVKCLIRIISFNHQTSPFGRSYYYIHFADENWKLTCAHDQLFGPGSLRKLTLSSLTILIKSLRNVIHAIFYLCIFWQPVQKNKCNKNLFPLLSEWRQVCSHIDTSTLDLLSPLLNWSMPLSLVLHPALEPSLPCSL